MLLLLTYHAQSYLLMRRPAPHYLPNCDLILYHKSIYKDCFKIIPIILNSFRDLLCSKLCWHNTHAWCTDNFEAWISNNMHAYNGHRLLCYWKNILTWRHYQKMATCFVCFIRVILFVLDCNYSTAIMKLYSAI